MKKLFSSMLIVFALAGCSVTTSSSSAEPVKTPETIGEDEFAAGAAILKKKDTDMSGYRWLDDPNPAFVQIPMMEVFKLMEEGGTGLLLLSYPDCPWCNRAVPVLNQTLKENGITGIYGDIYEDEIRAMTREEWDLFQKDLYVCLDAALDHQTNPDTGKMDAVMYVPLVIAVKDGKIVDHHTSLVESFKMEHDDDQLTDEQKKELKSYYERLIERIR